MGCHHRGWFQIELRVNSIPVHGQLRRGAQKHVAILTNTGDSTWFFNLMGQVYNTTGNSLDGMLDEVRIATANRSPEWVATQLAIQSNPNGFYTVGPEQQPL